MGFLGAGLALMSVMLILSKEREASEYLDRKDIPSLGIFCCEALGSFGLVVVVNMDRRHDAEYAEDIVRCMAVESCLLCLLIAIPCPDSCSVNEIVLQAISFALMPGSSSKHKEKMLLDGCQSRCLCRRISSLGYRGPR